MSEKTSKPWSFGLLSSKKGGNSVVMFIIACVVSVVVFASGYVKDEIQDRRAHPQLALNSRLRDVREFYKSEKRMPQDWREIEVKIWNKGNAALQSRLDYGNKLFVADNYEYHFFSGNVQGVGIVNIWAIPIGKYRDEADSLLIVIAPEGEDVWRGPALTEQQRDFVVTNGFNPSFPQMAALNMSKEKKNQPGQQQQNNSRRFGL